MRKALIVGIDYYKSLSELFGCVNDAHGMKSVLERNFDSTKNFHINMLTASSERDSVSKRELKDAVVNLFSGDEEVALLYFAGHGYVEDLGGYLITSDCKDGDDGFSMNELMKIVNNSTVKNKIIVLDSCHSGVLGTERVNSEESILATGVTILTASTVNQYSEESEGHGLFTSLFIDAMNGSAANLLGYITPSSVYSHIDQSLGPWQQRPVFKTNVKNFVALRKTSHSIELDDLKRIVDYFPNKFDEFRLNPSFEPDSENPNDDNNRVFSILQKYNRVNLLVPVDEEHMYYAAMNSKSCKLTVLGEHYWELVKKEML